MADQKITALTANTTPLKTDILPMVDDPGGTPATQKITFENALKVINDLTANTTPVKTDVMGLIDDPTGTPAAQKITLENLLKVLNDLTADTAPVPSTDYLVTYDASASLPKKVLVAYILGALTRPGQMINGKIQVSVDANDLTLALKTLSGGDPSASDPVFVNINGTIRVCTAALSVTKNDATNWANAGGAELATKEIDWFAYAIWNTTPGTDILDVGFARIPWGRVYSDFSATTTNEKYLAHANASDPAATDDVAVIGRFAATLSAGAAYTWSVPTFTNANLIQEPIFKTRILTYAPVYTGFSSAPSGPARYRIVGGMLYLVLDNVDGTSNATGFTVTTPFGTSAVSALFPVLAKDNGTLVLSVGHVSSSASTITFYKGASITAASWTGSGAKGAWVNTCYSIGS